MPAWQEAQRIGPTVAALRRLEVVREVVVVDDGSRDGTAERAHEAGARVVVLPRRTGKAAALQEGVRAAREPCLLLCDADLGESASALGRLCAAVAGGQADLAIGVVPYGGGAGLGLVRRLASAGVRRLGGCSLRAPLSGQRALVARMAGPLLDGPPCGFGVEVRMDVRALRMGLRVVEVEVPVRHRPTGWDLSGVRHRGRQLVDVARTLAQLAAEDLGREKGGAADGGRPKQCRGNGGPVG